MILYKPRSFFLISFSFLTYLQTNWKIVQTLRNVMPIQQFVDVKKDQYVSHFTFILCYLKLLLVIKSRRYSRCWPSRCLGPVKMLLVLWSTGRGLWQNNLRLRREKKRNVEKQILCGKNEQKSKGAVDGRRLTAELLVLRGKHKGLGNNVEVFEAISLLHPLDVFIETVFSGQFIRPGNGKKPPVENTQRHSHRVLE